jgi:methylenetetrahydrofolate--tRNA-(uracil-5-)-methyltransferase
MSEKVTIIGGGLAGSAAALELASRGIPVVLYEMRPAVMTPAHASGNLAELVCSNSLGSSHTFAANGLLMAELEMLDCKLLKIAQRNNVPAGKALAVDRIKFSEDVTRVVSENRDIELRHEEIKSIPGDSICLIASGPLTSDALIHQVKSLTGEENLYFFDATSPTVTLDSIDMSKAFWGNRRDNEGADYLNCPMNPDEFDIFYRELVNAERIEIKDFEPDKLFESCLPVEIIAGRQKDALRFGPLKPVGLKHPQTQERFYSVVQLRREDTEGSRLNMVGFQTRLKYPEQKRVFRLIPALQNAEFVRFGHMHRNFFMNAPRLLDEFLRLKTAPALYFAGQITGGEGYLEAIAQGTFTGINISRVFHGQAPVSFPSDTLMGAFPLALTGSSGSTYQPMKVSFSLLPQVDKKIRGKRLRREKQSERSLEELAKFIKEHKLLDD